MNGVQASCPNTWPKAWQSAEEAVIGCCFADSGDTVARAIKAGLTVNSFSHPPCAITFQVMTELLAKLGAAAVNIEVVGPELLKRGQLEMVGGYPFFTQITNDHPTTAHAGHFIAEVKEYEARRMLASKGHALIEMLDAGIEAGELQHHIAEMMTTLPAEAASDASVLPPILTTKNLLAAVVGADQLPTITIPVRENVCGHWFKVAELGFIFGVRGLGKTMLGLGLATGMAKGESIATWHISKARRVLYVDGEMPLDDIRARLDGLNGLHPNLTVLNHEQLFTQTDAALNLADRSQQKAITALCRELKTEVLFLDNLSALSLGMKENDADDWEKVQPWLLDLRRRGVAVVIVHHAGRNGEHMRGTSKREDAATWVVHVGKPTSEDADERDGQARFIVKFKKCRNLTPKAESQPRLWHFHTPPGSKTLLVTKPIDNLDMFRALLRDGVTRCADLAEEMGVTKGAVSKMAKKGIGAGWCKKDGNEYHSLDPA